MRAFQNHLFLFFILVFVLTACGQIENIRSGPILPQSVSAIPGVVPVPSPGVLPTATPRGMPSPTPSATPIGTLPTLPVSGTSCRNGDPARQCLGVQVIVFKDAQGNSMADPVAMEAAFAQVNRVWNYCNIGFQMETFSLIDPTNYGLSYLIPDSLSFLYSFVAKFKTTSSLVVGVSGPWSEYHLGWSFISPGDPLGLVLNPTQVSRPYTLAHELGHYIGLDHVSDSANVMNSIDNGGVQGLNMGQCQSARANIPAALPSAMRH